VDGDSSRRVRKPPIRESLFPHFEFVRGADGRTPIRRSAGISLLSLRRFSREREGVAAVYNIVYKAVYNGSGAPSFPTFRAMAANGETKP
jgi:hypothetical protein